MNILENYPLAPLTTFCIGGEARFFVEVKSREELKEAVAFAREKGLAVFILGGGSNVLIPDRGFKGLVVRMAIRGVSFEDEGEYVRLTAEAGEIWDDIVHASVEQNLWGMENLSGIPGTVGGAVVQNIGAYGAALSQTLFTADVFDTHTGSVRILSREECAFGYRESIFKKEAGRYVVLRASFSLSKKPIPDISYKDLTQRFEGMVPTLPAVRDAVLEIRRNKFPDLSAEGTAGSFFKNPVLSGSAAEALAMRFPGLPLFALPESSGKKVPIAWLLDWQHGVLDMRGARVGGARLFEKQPLVIAAARNTSSNDVAALAMLVREKIKNACGIEIENEVHIL